MSFGGGSIDKKLYNTILEIIPDGNTILELGSGWATGQLANNYEMISIENDENWLNKYDSNYIHAPLEDDGEDKWYSLDVLEEELPGLEYNAILVDGPKANGPRKGRRLGFSRHLDLFDLEDTFIFFDDTDRQPDYFNFRNTKKELGRKGETFKAENSKFSIIYPWNTQQTSAGMTREEPISSHLARIRDSKMTPEMLASIKRYRIFG